MIGPSRDFKGIWIPASIWLDKRLTYFEKCLLSEIHSLDGKDGCFASNEYLCTFFQERERKIQDGLSKLKKFGYIQTESFDGRTRVLRSNLNVENDKSLFSTSGVSNSAPLTCRNPHPYPYIDNIVYKKEQQLDTCTSEGCDSAAAFSSSDDSEHPSLDIPIVPTVKPKAKEPPKPPPPPPVKKAAAQSKPAEKPPVKPKVPEVPKIHEDLVDLDMKEAEKIEITARYSSECVKNAVKWATSPSTKLSKGLVPAIKWACQNAPEVPKNAKDKIDDNRALVDKYDGMKNAHSKVEVCASSVEIVRTGNCESIVIGYDENGFLEKFHLALKKCGLKRLE